MFRAAQAAAVQLVRLGYRRATTGDARSMIAGHRTAIEEAGAALPPGWTAEGERVRTQLRQAADAAPLQDLVTVAGELADLKRKDLLIAKEAAPGLTSAWELLAAAVRSLLGDLRQMPDPESRVSRAEAAGAIDVYLQYFGATEQPPPPRQVAAALLKLILAERALLPADTELDQPVEFVQFSANTRTRLAPADDSLPASQQLDSVTKLRGVELHHFAAFYKSSCRRPPHAAGSAPSRGVGFPRLPRPQSSGSASWSGI